jgi:hypothetical protein
MEVFEESWVEALEQQYGSASKYTTPFVARLVLDPVLARERTKIEEWFQTLPENAKPDIRGRLRDKNSHQHLGAYYELVLYQFFKSMGYSVTIHPRLPEGEPDLLVTGKNLEKPIIVEIATVFDDPDWQKEEQKLNLILEMLDSIEHYFFISVIVHSEHIPERVDYKKLKQFVTGWLDGFDPKITHTVEEIGYEANGLKLKLILIPKKTLKKEPIVGGHMLPARFIGATQLRRMLGKKTNKYKSISELKMPFIIALNITNMPAGERGLLNELFVKPKFTIKINTNGKASGVEPAPDFSGLLTPKPGLGGKAQNTRLSAILNVVSKWPNREEADEPARRIHYFRVIHNYWASNPLSHDVFKGYPQFVKISEDEKGISFDWIDKGTGKPFDC